jgi:RHS repeat-associated protein
MVALVFVMDSYWTWCELQHDFLPTRELAGFGERREVQSMTGAVAQNLRFPGQYFQLETGLAYNWHRTYDPVTGRYTQPDPLRFVDGPSVYAYVGNSPLMNSDVTGLVQFTNWSNRSILVGGGPGHGDGHDGDFVRFLVPPGASIDECHPGVGPNGELVYDIDVVDFNGDGQVVPPMSMKEHWPLGEKFSGGSLIIAYPFPFPKGWDWIFSFPNEYGCGCKPKTSPAPRFDLFGAK